MSIVLSFCVGAALMDGIPTYKTIAGSFRTGTRKEAAVCPVCQTVVQSPRGIVDTTERQPPYVLSGL